mmetsp:Transcript_51550/g.159727  ORF Transcript_51550/g.159727 Transcript_51550/m.159727 type:complete len:275 (-) Transcript_51550:643-1467(-)
MQSMCYAPLVFRGLGGWCALLSALLAVPAATGQEVVNVGTANDAEEPVVSALHASTLELNRFTFGGNVLRHDGSGSHVAHWVVAFCPSWWEPCQNLEGPYAELSRQWEGTLNTALLTKEVRFAMVDCASDKVLCNEQDVESYPTVHHYHEGQRVASWSGGRKDDPARLAKWLGGQLAKLAAEPAPSLTGDFQEAFWSYLMPGDRAIDLLLVLLVLGLNFRAVSRNPELWRKACIAARQPEAAAGPCDEAVQQGRPGVARFLPEAWANARPSLRL